MSYKHGVAVFQGPFYRVLGERLRDARCHARVSQLRLALAVGLSRSSIANIESGRQPIYIHSLVSIAGQLGVSLSELLSTERPAEDHLIQNELKKLNTQKQEWVIGILKSSVQTMKEDHGTEVRTVKKTGYSASEASPRKKAAGTHRKTRSPARG